MLTKTFCKDIPQNFGKEKPRTLEQVVDVVLLNVPKEYGVVLAMRRFASFASSDSDSGPDFDAASLPSELLRTFEKILEKGNDELRSQGRRGGDQGARGRVLYVWNKGRDSRGGIV